MRLICKWTKEELERIGKAEELQIMNCRIDGTLRKKAFGILAVIFTQFSILLFIDARNNALLQMIAELDGFSLFSWLIPPASLFNMGWV